MNAHGVGPREFFSVFPRYAGDPNDLEDWIARAERIKVDCEILDVSAIRECAGKLDGLAAEWHNQIGANQINWAEWLERLRNSFGRPMSAIEWQCQVEARVRQPGESVAAYVFDKVKLFRRCPLALNEAGYITYLVRGLNNPETRSALSRNPPNTADGLMTLINQVQAYQPVPLTSFPLPSAPRDVPRNPFVPRLRGLDPPRQPPALPAPLA